MIKYDKDCFKRNCEDCYYCCLKLLSHLGIVCPGDHSKKLFHNQKNPVVMVNDHWLAVILSAGTLVLDQFSLW